MTKDAEKKIQNLSPENYLGLSVQLSKETVKKVNNFLDKESCFTGYRRAETFNKFYYNNLHEPNMIFPKRIHTLDEYRLLGRIK